MRKYAKTKGKRCQTTYTQTHTVKDKLMLWELGNIWQMSDKDRL